MNSVSRKKWQVFWMCWVVYAGGYLGRTNLAIALPQIMGEMAWDRASLGMIGTAFFWSYAVGQLINGNLGDRLNSRRFVLVGLLVSAGVNLLVGFTQSLSFLVVLWALNGYALSCLWGPVIRTLSLWFPEAERQRVAFLISTSMMGGYFVSWGFTGWIIAQASWRWAFWAPAAMITGIALLWSRLIPDINPVPEIRDHARQPLSLKALFASSGLALVALACLAQGVVKDGINLWGPLFLEETHSLAQAQLAGYSLFIPAMSLLGIFLARWLNQALGSQELRATGVFFIGAALGCLALAILPGDVLGTAFILGGVAAFMYGVNTLLLAIVPLRYASQGRVSGVAGVLDFCSYLGAALSSPVVGLLTDQKGWSVVLLLWSGLSLAGAWVIYVARKGVSRRDCRKGEVV